MSSSGGGNRKRSRWGDRPTSDNADAVAASSAPAVSDQEALEALLASAKSKEEQQKPQRPPYSNNNNKRDDFNNSKRPRREDERGPPSRDREQYNNNNKDRRRGGGNNNNNKDKDNGQDYSYYGNPDHKPGEGAEEDDEEDSNNNKNVEKPNFALSGALAQEDVGELKFREPPEARAPNTLWRFYVFKKEQALETLHVSKQSAYLFGRNQELADIPLLHPSASGQHAVLQYRALPGKDDGRMRCKPYLMDLESTNGSFINGVRIDPARYYELRKGDVLTFGASTREYVLLTENTTSIK